jgi:hypothetical protein
VAFKHGVEIGLTLSTRPWTRGYESFRIRGFKFWIKWIGTHKDYDKIDVKEVKYENLKPIRSEADYQAALEEIETLWGARAGTPAGNRLDILATLIDAYENEHYPMDPPDPMRRSNSAWSNKG